MKLPLIERNDNYYPKKPICPICKKNKIFEPHSFISINGTSFKKKGTELFASGDLVGFLSIVWHDEEDSENQRYVVLNIIEECYGGQYDLIFCSVKCLRKFLNNVCDEIEKRIDGDINPEP